LPVDKAICCIQNVFVRIIKVAFLKAAAGKYPKAASYLETWRETVEKAWWRSLADVRLAYPAADGVRMRSGRKVIVFNVCGNDYRLIAAAHFNTQIIFTLRFLTHAEYTKDKWKNEL
jgi:mRNA interferase HigB